MVTFHSLHNTGRFSHCQRPSLPKGKVLWVMISLLIVRTHTIRLWIGTSDSRSVHCCRGFGHILVEDERIELSTLRCKRSVFPLALIPQNWRGLSFASILTTRLFSIMPPRSMTQTVPPHISRNNTWTDNPCYCRNVFGALMLTYLLCPINIEKVGHNLAGVVGIEPTTEWLTVTWSTADLHANTYHKLVRPQGLEPWTYCLKASYSTIELWSQNYHNK